jgi:signal transduction histidine kinase
MSPRPRRGALGLRGRIVGLVLFTTVATLAVAALTLLGPLESKLRDSALTTLRNDVRNASISSGQLTTLDLSQAVYYNPPYTNTGFQQVEALRAVLGRIDSRLGAATALLGFNGPNGEVTKPLYATAPDETSPYDDVARLFVKWDALRGHSRPPLLSSLATDADGTEVARVAYPVWIGNERYVLAIRRPINEIPSAVSVVSTAFLIAALAGLGLSVLLGISLSGPLVRRLRRLRIAALRLTEGGTVVLPEDRARDEVGDLARTFATMQHQLHQQEEARRAFVATASHELRTPLASLDGMLELLDEDLRDPGHDVGEALALLQRARVQSRRLARLAADLLDLSRLDAEIRLRSEPVELAELGRAVLAEFDLGTAERGIRSALEMADGPVWALADPGSVARIVRILLDNAVRVSPPGSEIKIELRNGEGAELSVSDQGPGIAPQDREVIFERFQRGRDTGGKAGFGLGLAIGRELAERMGGKLELDPDFGPGARFILRLPVAPRPEVGALAVS